MKKKRCVAVSVRRSVGRSVGWVNRGASKKTAESFTKCDCEANRQAAPLKGESEGDKTEAKTAGKTVNCRDRNSGRQRDRRGRTEIRASGGEKCLTRRCSARAWRPSKCGLRDEGIRFRHNGDDDGHQQSMNGRTDDRTAKGENRKGGENNGSIYADWKDGERASERLGESYVQLGAEREGSLHSTFHLPHFSLTLLFGDPTV